MRGRLFVLILACAEMALAEAPTTSVRPLPRPLAQVLAPPAAEPTPTTLAPVTAPKPRPEALTATPAPVAEAVVAPAPVLTAAPPTPPKPRPADLVTSVASAPTAEAPAAKSSKKKGKKGSVCGDSDIRGEALSAIPAKYKGCGLDEPVRVTMVSDVALNPAATISCDTADALKKWVETGVRPAFGNRKVVELKVAASYICRTRNNVKGAKISEHGRGKAIDISGFVMSDGTLWTVANNYNSTIRKAHRAACGIFGTTLGPGSDGYHEDHLHFDIARYNSGTYCR